MLAIAIVEMNRTRRCPNSMRSRSARICWLDVADDGDDALSLVELVVVEHAGADHQRPRCSSGRWPTVTSRVSTLLGAYIASMIASLTVCEVLRVITSSANDLPTQSPCLEAQDRARRAVDGDDLAAPVEGQHPVAHVFDDDRIDVAAGLLGFRAHTCDDRFRYIRNCHLAQPTSVDQSQDRRPSRLWLAT